jgi:hypothetical protein
MQTPSLHCAQEIEVVHEHKDVASKAKTMKRLMIIPIEKGAIQIQTGTGVPEDRLKRMEENVCGFVAVATRLHPEVADVAYGQATYRPEVGRNEETQFYYSTRVSESAFEAILAVGVETKEGAPGWSSVERAVLSGTEDKWVIVKGTMIQMFQAEGAKEDVEKEREITAIVIDAECWQDHPRMASRQWKPPDPLEVPFTAFVHNTHDVAMEVIPYQQKVRQRFCQSLGARMLPVPAAGGWKLEREELRRAVRTVRIRGVPSRSMFVGWKLAGKLVWSGGVDTVEAAKEALFLPSTVTVWDEVRMVEVETPNPAFVEGGEEAKTLVKAVARGQREAEVDVFWGMPGAPVTLPQMATPTEGAIAERKAWEAAPMRMLAVGGLKGAQAYAAEATAQRRKAGKSGQQKLAAQKPIQEERAKLLAPLLKQLLDQRLEGTLDSRRRVPCMEAVGRLSRSLSRCDPPVELTAEALQPFLPVMDLADPMAPMFVPEAAAKQACYQKEEAFCSMEICWSVHRRKQLGQQLWPPQLVQGVQQQPQQAQLQHPQQMQMPQMQPPPMQMQPGPQPPQMQMQQGQPMQMQPMPPQMQPPPPMYPPGMQPLPPMFPQPPGLGPFGSPQKRPAPETTLRHNDWARAPSKRHQEASRQTGSTALQEALENLQSAFMSSTFEKDQAAGCLFQRVFTRFDVSPQGVAVMRTMFAYVRERDGWRQACPIDGLMQNVYDTVEGVTPDDIAEAIGVLDREEILISSNRENCVEFQHCMVPKKQRQSVDPDMLVPGGRRYTQQSMPPGGGSSGDRGSRFRQLEERD